MVRAVARGRLREVASGFYRVPEAITLQVDLLNRENSSRPDGRRFGAPGELWAQLRPVSRRLGLRWAVSREGNFTVTTNDLLIESGKKFTRVLHHVSNTRWLSRWGELSDQGKTVSCHSRFGCSNHFLSTSSSLAQFEVSWVLKARLNLLPLRSVRRRFRNYPEPRVTCCKCGRSYESLPHVLNHFRPVMDVIRARHDSVQEELLAHLPPSRFPDAMLTQSAGSTPVEQLRTCGPT